MSTRALLRRSREARAWLLDAMVPLWCHAALTREGSVISGLDLNHRAPEAPRSDPVATARLASALARIARLDPGQGALDPVLDAILADRLEGEGSETLLARAAWLLAHALVSGTGASAGQRALPTALPGVVEAAHRQATKLVAGKAFRAAGLPSWFDACLALSVADRGKGHIGRASGLAASLIAFLGTRPDGVFSRDGEPVDIAEQFNWSWRLADHARAIGSAVPGEAGRLYAFACSTLDADGVAPDRLSADLDGGTPPDGTSPGKQGRGVPAGATALTMAAQAAALMAHLSRLQDGVDAETARLAAASFDALMDNHLTPEGGWIAAYDAAGLPVDRQIETRHADLVSRAFTRLIDITAAW